MRWLGEAETVRACAEDGGVRTGRKPATASEGEAKEDPLNIVGMAAKEYKGYNIVGMEGVVRIWSVDLTHRFRDLLIN